MLPKILLLILTILFSIREYEALDRRCRLPIMRGTGPDVEMRWAFVHEPSTCLPFHYTGTGGNENNFFTERECWSYCSR